MSLIFLAGCSNPYGTSYQVLEKFKVPLLRGEATQLTHKLSGARIVLLKNEDPALSFMTSFRTPPYDDTGLFHIFEHAVLAGSKLYPSKSIFFNIKSSSVASSMNASTGSVSTHYFFYNSKF